MTFIARIIVLSFIAFLGGRGVGFAQKPAAPAPPGTSIPAPPTPQELFRSDVHAKAGLTCASCHGTPANGTITALARTDIAPLCARCHADAAMMHKANPNLPIDQLENWKQSVHAAALQTGDSSAPTCSTCHGAHGIRPVETIKAEQVCGQCHAREADLYNASPKKKIFEEADHPACVTCHENHKIVRPGDNWISMKDPVSPCQTCHDDTMNGAKEITLEQEGFQKLTAGIERATAVLDRAERVGMLVDDGRNAIRDAKEQQIQARVMVHAFAAAPFSKALDSGLEHAATAEQIGNDALAELQFRRKGLAVATFLILGFLGVLWLKIRRLPPI
jgi:predicted CXXCH cytochrome family protein